MGKWSNWHFSHFQWRSMLQSPILIPSPSLLPLTRLRTPMVALAGCVAGASVCEPQSPIRVFHACSAWGGPKEVTTTTADTSQRVESRVSSATQTMLVVDDAITSAFMNRLLSLNNAIETTFVLSLFPFPSIYCDVFSPRSLLNPPKVTFALTSVQLYYYIWSEFDVTVRISRAMPVLFVTLLVWRNKVFYHFTDFSQLCLCNSAFLASRPAIHKSGRLSTRQTAWLEPMKQGR